VNNNINKIAYMKQNKIGMVNNILKNIADNTAFKIFNIQGRLVKSVNRKSSLSLDYLQNGVYIIVVENK
jgi:hypothetical protein